MLTTQAKGDERREPAGQESPVFSGDVIEVPDQFFSAQRQDCFFGVGLEMNFLEDNRFK